MIVTPHIIVGAAIGAKTHNLGLIVILGLISHIIMDKIPHWDYSWSTSIENFKKEKSIKYLMPVLIKVSIDIAIGITLIGLIIWQKNLFSPNSLFFMALGIIFACLPDLILTLALFFPSQKFLQKYFILHEKCFHFQHQEKEGQITFLGLATQILVVIMAIALFVS